MIHSKQAALTAGGYDPMNYTRKSWREIVTSLSSSLELIPTADDSKIVERRKKIKYDNEAPSSFVVESTTFIHSTDPYISIYNHQIPLYWN